MKSIKRETAGEDLLNFIDEKGLTQKSIAEKSGLTEQTISKIVYGKKPNALTLMKLNRFIASHYEVV